MNIKNKNKLCSHYKVNISNDKAALYETSVSVKCWSLLL